MGRESADSVVSPRGEPRAFLPEIEEVELDMRALTRKRSGVGGADLQGESLAELEISEWSAEEIKYGVVRMEYL